MGLLRDRRDGPPAATVHKALVGIRDRFAIDGAPGEDVPLILAVTVAIDSLTTRD